MKRFVLCLSVFFLISSLSFGVEYQPDIEIRSGVQFRGHNTYGCLNLSTSHLFYPFEHNTGLGFGFGLEINTPISFEKLDAKNCVFNVDMLVAGNGYSDVCNTFLLNILLGNYVEQTISINAGLYFASVYTDFVLGVGYKLFFIPFKLVSPCIGWEYRRHIIQEFSVNDIFLSVKFNL